METLPQNSNHRTHGFRFSRTDAVVLAACVAPTLLLYQPTNGPILLIPIVLFHFFLFCNVFRIPRRPELVWSATFILNYLLWSLSTSFSWLEVLAVQTPITISLIAREMLQPTYHGVFASRINQRYLGDYLSGGIHPIHKTSQRSNTADPVDPVHPVH